MAHLRLLPVAALVACMGATFAPVAAVAVAVAPSPPPPVAGVGPTYGADPLGAVSTQFLHDSTTAARAGVADGAGHEVLAGTIDGDFGLTRVQRWVNGGFGGDELVVTDFGGDDDAANAVALGSDGRVVAAGTAHGDLAVAQYDAGGTLDNGFGSFGKATRDVGSAGDAAYGVAVLPDLRVLVAGGNGSGIVLWRLNPDGSDDATFGSGGLAVLPGAGPGRGLVVQPDGRAVVVSGETDRVTVTRVLANGSPDPSFGQAGSASAVLGPGTTGRAISLGPDGGIVVAGTTHGDLALARFRPDGSLDTGFGLNGVAVDDLGAVDTAYGVYLDPGGVIWVAGDSSAGHGFVASYVATGRRNTDFQAGGVMTTPNHLRGINAGPYTGWATSGSPGNGFGYDLYSVEFGIGTGGNVDPRNDIFGAPAQSVHQAVPLPGGQVLLVGEVSGDTGLVRLNADGSRDPTFGHGGLAMSDLVSYGTGAVVEADGRTVVLGRHDGTLALAAFLPDGRPDPSFGTRGRSIVGGGSHNPAGPGLVVVGGGKLLVGAVDDEYALTLARFTPDGLADPTFGTNGVITKVLPGSYHLVGNPRFVVQPDGRILLYNYDDGVHRLNADGSLDLTFGVGGVIRFPFVDGFSAPSAFALEPDGRIVVGGSTLYGFFVGRYLPNGLPDPTWDRSRLPQYGELLYNRVVTSLAVEPDGKIVAAGPGAVARYLPTGALDPTFAYVGSLGLDPSSQTGQAWIGGGHLFLASRIGLANGNDGPGFLLTRVALDVPGAPTDIGATAGSGSVHATWTPPPADTAVPVTGYLITATDKVDRRAVSATVGPTQRTGVVGGLANDHEHSVAVRAVGADGPGFASAFPANASPMGFETWGYNAQGEIGSGSTSVSLSTWAQSHLGQPAVTSVAAGGLHTLAATSDGTVRAWGWNGCGALGDGSTTDRSSPVTVPGLTGVTAVSAGLYHSLALRSDGTVWAWGWNGLGQIGDGTTTTRLTPVRVPGLTGVVAISAGALHNVVVRSDGTVWTWGWNGFGQLGDETVATRMMPAAVPALSGVVGASAGGYHSLAVRSDGSVWAWGWNGYGQLGNGSTADQHHPVRTGGVVGVSTVAAGAAHSMALRSDGTVVAWGLNAFGQLGVGTNVDSHVAVVVPGLSEVRAIAAGWYVSVVATADGSVRAWGWNGLGQLGNGTTVDRASPVRVGDSSFFVVHVAAGLVHTVVG